MLKNEFLILIICLVLVVPAYSADLLQARVDYVVGRAELQRAGTNIWVTIEEGMIVSEGDVIRTQAGAMVDLQFDENSYSRIAENSRIEIQRAQLETQEIKKLFFSRQRKSMNIRLNIQDGRVLSNVGDLKSHETFEVSTPTAVAGVRGTVFDASHRGMTSVRVISGVVAVTNPAVSAVPTFVMAGQVTSVVSNQMPTPPRAMSQSEAADVSGFLEGSSVGAVDAPDADVEAAAPAPDAEPAPDADIAEVSPDVEAAPDVAPEVVADAPAEVAPPPAPVSAPPSSISESISNTVLAPSSSNPIMNIIQQELPKSRLRVNINIK